MEFYRICPEYSPQTAAIEWTYTYPPGPACDWCDQWHEGVCPRVKAYEYHPDGTLKRVEFHDGRQQEVTGYYADNVADREWPPKTSGG